MRPDGTSAWGLKLLVYEALRATSALLVDEAFSYYYSEFSDSRF
jgi:hypothetical protein